jgi:predicted RNase H-like HicB family nuclease
MSNETFTIQIQPLEDGRLRVTVPEIEAVVIIAGTKIDDAVDAAHEAIDEYLLKQRETSARARAS